MPQIAIIQAAAPQPPPQAPPANYDSQGFSPHLEKAISDKNDQLSPQGSSPKTREEKASETNKINNIQDVNKNPPNQTEKSAETADSKKTLPTDDKKSDALTTADQTTGQIKAENQADIPEVPTLSQQLNNTSPLFAFLSNNSANNKDSIDLQGLSLEKSTQNYMDEGLIPAPSSKEIAPAKAENDVLPASTQPLQAKSKANIFLQQIQKIIENSNESGNPSITVTESPLKAQEVQAKLNSLLNALPSATSGKLQATQASSISGKESQSPVISSPDFSDIDGQMVLVPNNSEEPGENTNQNLSKMRLTIQQQYFEGKIAQEINPDSQTSSEEGRPENSVSSQNAQTKGEKTAASLPSDQITTFAQSIALGPDGSKLTSVEALPTVTLPSGTVIQQAEVVRQIVERFQIARRDLDTRVNIQLHPAELGEVQVTLSVKEGSVRANVVASSQYAQEIIEKNMTKLRTVLENQGFNIDKISVTTKADAPGDFNLFERQLFSKNEYTPPSPKKPQSTGEFFVTEDYGLKQQTTTTGINVNI